LENGLLGGDFPARKEFFGDNFRPPLKAKTFCKIFFEALDDFMLKVLIVAATGSLIFEYIGADPDHYSTAWFDAAAIYLAVLIVSGFSAFVDWRKEREFVLRAQEEKEGKLINVMRHNAKNTPELMKLNPDELQVGDIIHLKTGDVVPVDGICVKSNQLLTNEAAMTGESDERRKEPLEICKELREKFLSENDGKKVDKSESHVLPSPIILSGTSVENGAGVMLVTVVGDNSALGEIIKKLEDRPKPTPLQLKLEVIAEEIGKLGTYAALLTIHVLLFRYFLDGILKREIDLFGGEPESQERPFAKNFKLWVDYVIIGVAVIVVAVPEGLPLAVMISLAYSQGKMLKDNNYVKKLAACEIMGGATNICSDKTGTLTLNKMQTARVWVDKDIQLNLDQDADGNMTKLDSATIFPSTHWPLLEISIACNTPDDCGATDRGMIDLLKRCDTQIDDLRTKYKVGSKDNFIRFEFSSNRKRMSTIISDATGQGDYDKRLLCKGASELVLAECSHYIAADGSRNPITDEKEKQIKDIIELYASNALRTIGLAYRDVGRDDFGGEGKHDSPASETGAVKDAEKKDAGGNGLTLVAVLGIYDIIRSEVPDAVDTCQRAGVTVRMITGDNLITAKAIAEKCLIITEAQKADPDICIEGPEFYKAMDGLMCMVCKEDVPIDCKCEAENRKERVKNFEAFKRLEPKMRVMARSRPEDKYLLVTGLMNMRQVVAVTGDGTNDAPALSKADVGFGMNIAGTEVCKKAADIIIMDDSFTSVVKACMWGRNIYDNIRRFLQFQLTVNVNALLFTVIGAVLLKESPLQAIQLLWVNMIMDSLASLALATELPRPDLLNRMPQSKDDFVVSRKMGKHILYMSLFQMVILFIFLFGGEHLIMEPDEELRFNQYRPLIGHEPSDKVFPGRLYGVDGVKLYKEVLDLEGIDGDASRHMTFIFNLFIWLQIVNMIAARKIHDELNICAYFFGNPAFVIIWIIIVGVNFLIIQYTGAFFQLHPKGLSWEQHVLCIVVSLSVLICNFILKLLPDDVAFKIGKDSVDDRRLAAKAAAAAAAQ